MPETAAGRAPLYAILDNRQIADNAELRDVRMGEVRELAREARALGRAEALAAVRAAVEGLWTGDDHGDCYCTGVLAAIDNLETP